ncbi:MAG: tRNA 2-thiouridine(34) synthase MnmA [Candidatus Pacebacteria bacterium]|nr:tRNA 2-thiouridine(34) synthase MnmA [Candidatus Paceibacterota bacterium]
MKKEKVSSGKKVYAGLSGGVDSSVSAALLKKQGYDVTGVFIKVWQPPFLACTWKEERLDAMRVAAKLDIPFKTLDLEKEYKESIVDHMVAEYKLGRTPNPDVMCNKTIKFGAFLKRALEEGADLVATGHYAQKTEKDGMYELHAGLDESKDQSYFLWTLTQDQLKYVLFPVGGYEKAQVRKLAKKFDLITADKKDSQGLCFMGKLNMKDFLKEFIEEKRGDILDDKGAVIGYHDGAVFYTLGQRRGFVITEKTPEDTPYYIVAKDIENNTITVSHQRESHLPKEKKKVKLTQANWISAVPEDGERFSVRIRYRQRLHECTIEKTNGDIMLVFDVSQMVDAGQSAVLYKEGRCVGGGVVK